MQFQLEHVWVSSSQMHPISPNPRSFPVAFDLISASSFGSDPQSLRTTGLDHTEFKAIEIDITHWVISDSVAAETNFSNAKHIPSQVIYNIKELSLTI